MRSSRTRKLSMVLAWCAIAQIAAIGPAAALTKIIVVPTARTIGARHYAVDLTRREPLFDARERTLDITPKAGLGSRAQLETKIPIRGPNSVLVFGKYTFATADRGLTAAAVGVENVGAGNRAVPYFAFSHLFQPVDVTVGVARGVEWAARYYAGVDYLRGEKLHILADYNTGNQTFASAGFQYNFARHWDVKSGILANRNGGSDSMVKVTYSNRY